QLRDPAGSRQDRARRRARARLPAPARGRARRLPAHPEQDPGGHPPRLRAGEVEGVTAAQLAAAVRKAVSGAVTGHEKGIDMPTITVKPSHLVAVCRYLRDQQGKNFLSAVTAVDHLGYGEEVAGYFGSERGRDINATGSWGSPATPQQPTKRFAVRYHLAHAGDGPPERVRVQVWLDDGESVPSVVSIWPTA